MVKGREVGVWVEGSGPVVPTRGPGGVIGECTNGTEIGTRRFRKEGCFVSLGKFLLVD